MTNRETILAIILSLLGLAIWIFINKLSGAVEAWDSNCYYFIGLPVMMIASAIACYLEPRLPWLWGITIVIFQPIALLVQSETSPLILAGLYFFVIFAVFTIVVHISVSFCEILKRIKYKYYPLF